MALGRDLYKENLKNSQVKIACQKIHHCHNDEFGPTPNSIVAGVNDFDEIGMKPGPVFFLAAKGGAMTVSNENSRGSSPSMYSRRAAETLLRDWIELRQEQPPPTAASHPLLLIVEHRRRSRRPLYRRTSLILSSRLFSLRPLLILSTHLYGKHSSAPPLLVDTTSVDQPTHILLSPVRLLRLCRWLAAQIASMLASPFSAASVAACFFNVVGVCSVESWIWLLLEEMLEVKGIPTSICVLSWQFRLRSLVAVSSAFSRDSSICVLSWQFCLHFLVTVPSAFHLCFLVAVPSAFLSGSSVCASFRQPAVPSALPSSFRGSSICVFFRQFRLHPRQFHLHFLPIAAVPSALSSDSSVLSPAQLPALPSSYKANNNNGGCSNNNSNNNHNSMPILEDIAGEAAEESAIVSGNPFSFASSETSQMITVESPLNLIRSGPEAYLRSAGSVLLFSFFPSFHFSVNFECKSSSEVSPRTSGRLSHSSGPPVSPTEIDDFKCSRSNNSHNSNNNVTSLSSQYRASATGGAAVAAGGGGGKTVGRWLKDRKENKEETRAHKPNPFFNPPISFLLSNEMETLASPPLSVADRGTCEALKPLLATLEPFLRLVLYRRCRLLTVVLRRSVLTASACSSFAQPHFFAVRRPACRLVSVSVSVVVLPLCFDCSEQR
ncbi:uncharacterized protein DS421_12g360880 [Arachis hypogaea]|nr:uncharacterized protein DS421_12g360880 [Arachis hypogaea]